jgi:hypothetical protein
MSLTNTLTNFGYDHPTYLARGTFNATMAAGASSILKFVAHANLQLMSVSGLASTVGTSTYTQTQYYPNGTTMTVHVAANQYTCLRIFNTAATGAAIALSTTTLAVFSPDLYSTSGTGTAQIGASFRQALNTGTGTAGLYGASVNQGDTIQINGGTDATAVSHFVVDYQVQPLANVTG